MARPKKRTTIIIAPEDESALRAAARAEGVSRSELIRRGIRAVTAAYRRERPRPSVGWLKLSKEEREEIAADKFGDPDA